MHNQPNAKTETVNLSDGRYILVHEIKQKKNETFQGAVMDEQFIIFPKRENEEDVQLDYDGYIDGFSDNYGDTTIYFVPNKDVVAAKSKVEKILEEWKTQGEHILEFDIGVIYIMK